MAFGVDAKYRTIELLGVDYSVHAAATEVAKEFHCMPLTVRRFVLGLDVVRFEQQGASEDELEAAKRAYRGARGTEDGLVRLRRAHRFHSWVHPAHAGHPQFQEWRARLDDLVVKLREVGAWATDDYDLALFKCAGTESWPYPGGTVAREALGIVVTPAVESMEGWLALKARFPELAVWSSLEAWKQGAAEDVTTRLELLDHVAALVERGYDQHGMGLQLPEHADEPAKGLGFRFAFAIYTRVLRHALGRDVASAVLLRRVGDRRVMQLDGHAVAVDLTSRQWARAKHLFTQVRAIAISPIGPPTAAGVKKAEAAAAKVRRAGDRLGVQLSAVGR